MKPETIDKFKKSKEKYKNRKLSDYPELVDKATKRIQTARISFIMANNANAFFASLSLALKATPTFGVDTMATDGKKLYYNPEFTCDLDEEQVKGVVIHEIMHCVFLHFLRQGDREKRKWNIAADLAINQLILNCGFKLLETCCIVGEGMFKDLPKNLSAEEYYHILNNTSECEKMGIPQSFLNEDFDCDIIFVGEDSPDGSKDNEADKDNIAKISKELADKWTEKVNETIHQCRQRGFQLGGLDRFLGVLNKPTVDWKYLLREFVTKLSKADYSWSKPNKKYIWRNIYLPSTRSIDEIGHIVVSLDSSGSIGEAELNRFASEINGITQQFVCKITILKHHAGVYDVQTHESSDGDLVLTKIESGGTSHVEVFQKLNEMMLDSFDAPVCYIGVTDLYSDLESLKEEAPSIPIMFLTPNDLIAPFGQTVKMID
jgi:predicted metal-dependent peptidase